MMKKFSVFYIILSFIKFFTARVDFQIEEGPFIILKPYPSIKNIFFGSDAAITYYERIYSWYKQRLYITLIPTKGDFFCVGVYDIVVMTWWTISACLIVYALMKLFNNK